MSTDDSVNNSAASQRSANKRATDKQAAINPPASVPAPDQAVHPVSSASITNPAARSLSKAREEAQQAQLQFAGRGRKLAMYAIGLQLALLLSRGLTQTTGLLQDVVLYLYCLAFMLSIFGIFLMARGLRFNSITTFVSVIAQFVPVINTLILLYLTMKATRALQQAGYQVSWLGVKTHQPKH
ncbi:hypothetical protein [Alkanindiges illinoisensis]|uniref:hypothetical protein n=1 Tax=Alkanindiges illinoisensis TaxID=197183 RepID=UPI000479F759|nr:hypothetical protein [Alkanindiges illinoisensis]